MQIRINKISRDAVKEIAEIHLQAFPESLISQLGQQAVERYYDWQFQTTRKLLFTCGVYTGEELAGYCFGGVLKNSLTGYLVKNKFFLVKQMICHPTIFLQKSFLKKILFGFKLLLRKQNNVINNLQTEPSFGILALAVKPTHRRLGLGKKIMEEAERNAVSQGFKAMHLTVNPKNANAVEFYRNLGWQEAEVTDWKGKMIKRING